MTISTKPNTSQILEGIVERITFHSEESGYTVAKLKVSQQKDLVTVVGAMAAIYIGESVKLTGDWSHHPKYGSQFKADACEKLLPATAVGLQKYLGSGLIKGIGPVTAKRLIKAFGTGIIEVIENEPDRLLEVSLIGPRKRDMIVKGWQEQKEIQNVMIFLQANGVSTAYAVKIYKHYGDQAIAVVQENPYRLAEDIWGIGFKTADTIARQLGYAADAPARLRAGVLYALNRATENGHVYLPKSKLLTLTAQLLEVEDIAFDPILTSLVADLMVKQEEGEDPPLYLTSLYYAEIGTANRLWRLQHAPPLKAVALSPQMKQIEQEQQVELSQEQSAAVLKALEHKILILTGGPGTGKTTVSKSMIQLFESQGLAVMLASPTGRAAKRLSEVTGREARTIHRLLKFDPKNFGFKHHDDNPLELDALLLDEVSMIDLVLFNNLLKALPLHARLVLVGDSDQLPSVGAGSVLKDMLQSGALPVAHLTQIFRQAQASLIITNAHRINKGESPVLLEPSGKNRAADTFFIAEEEPTAIAAQILNLVQQRLPQAGYGVDDIQVLCPMNRGEAGTHNLNLSLQATLNPPADGKPEITRGQRTFRQGDRVIQLRNNYDHGVFNGDMGKISAIDRENQSMTVTYPDEEIVYDFSELDELALAYALTVHKSQGSEYPVVIVPVSTQHYMMLQRNLIYTAVTRARRLLILVGTRKAIAMAVKNSATKERYSGLAGRLQSLKDTTCLPEKE